VKACDNRTVIISDSGSRYQLFLPAPKSQTKNLTIGGRYFLGLNIAMS